MHLEVGKAGTSDSESFLLYLNDIFCIWRLKLDEDVEILLMRNHI